MKCARNLHRESRARLRGSIARRWAVLLDPSIPPFAQEFMDSQYRKFIAHYPGATAEQRAAVVRWQRGPTMDVSHDRVAISFDAPGGKIASFGEFARKVQALITDQR